MEAKFNYIKVFFKSLYRLDYFIFIVDFLTIFKGALAHCIKICNKLQKCTQRSICNKRVHSTSKIFKILFFRFNARKIKLSSHSGVLNNLASFLKNFWSSCIS